MFSHGLKKGFSLGNTCLESYSMNRKSSAQQVLLLLAFLSLQAVPKTVATGWLLDDLCLLQPRFVPAVRAGGKFCLLGAELPCSPAVSAPCSPGFLFLGVRCQDMSAGLVRWGSAPNKSS